MSVSASRVQQVGQAFFNLYHQNEPEINDLFETIQTNLAGITQSPGDFKYIMPTIDHFRDDSVISFISYLCSATNYDTGLAGKVLYIRWYYQMTLLAMGSLAAKKVVDYIHGHTNYQVNVKLSGSNFLYVLKDAVGFSIRYAASGGPFDPKYSGFKLYSPLWDDDILETCVHAEGGEESLMRLEMPGAFSVNNEVDHSIYWQDHLPLTEMGRDVKEEFIDKIKEIIANRQ